MVLPQHEKHYGPSDADSDALDTSTLPPPSTLPSTQRSVVTKAVLRGEPGGFDEYGDPDAGLGKIRISSARPTTAASIVQSMMRAQDVEDVHHLFGCCQCWAGVPLTNNVKALIVMMVMFASISFAQYFAADYCGSQALKADVVSMAVDAVSYFGNILGESSDAPAQRVVLQLVFSLASIVLLLYFNTTTIMESIDGLRGIEGEEEAPAANPGAEGTIVIVFAGLGLTFDIICLFAYWFYAKKDADIEYEELKAQTERMGEDAAGLDARIKKPAVNMFSALIHVSADLFRSTSTFVLGCLMVSGSLDEAQSDQGDGILAVIISATIYLAAALALLEWCKSSSDWYSSLGESIEVVCPPGIEPGDTIRIEPLRAGHGKAADAFMG